MRLLRTHDDASGRREAAAPVYRARHLRLDVPADATPETEQPGGSHALREKPGVIRRLVGTDAAGA